MSQNSNNRQRAGLGFRFVPPVLAALGIALSFGTGVAQAGPEFSDWSTPSATVGGGCPIESRDGNYLYTASSSAGTLDIWVYRRHGRSDSFGARAMLGPPVSLPDAQDFCPTPLTGNWLMFVSTRDVDGACGGSDIFLTRYQAYPPRSLGEARHLACAPEGPNTGGTSFGPL